MDMSEKDCDGCAYAGGGQLARDIEIHALRSALQQAEAERDELQERIDRAVGEGFYVGIHHKLMLGTLAPECGNERCEHEDECPVDFTLAVCSHCFGLFDEVTDFEGSPVPSSVMWPCRTFAILSPTEEER